jgi:hypothetical protein
MNTPGTPPSGARPESHFESAQQANDIYDLYGRDSIYSISGSGADDSASASGSGAASGSGFSSGAGSVLGYARGPSQLRYANRERDHRDDENEQEELDEEFHTPLAFDKEIDFSRAPSRGPDFSQPYAAETQYSRRADSTWTDASEYTEPDEAEVGGQGSNYPYGGGIAGAAFPATMSGESTPTATARGSVSRRGSGDGNGVGLTPVALAGPAFANSRTSTPTPSIVRTEPDADDAPPSPMSAIPPRIRTGTPDLASASTVNSSNTLSPTPTSGSPVHPSITRIYTGSRSGSARSDSMRHSPVSGANSNASLVSSQYPGEDTDAYHVRSTCELECHSPQLTPRRASRH